MDVGIHGVTKVVATNRESGTTRWINIAVTTSDKQEHEITLYLDRNIKELKIETIESLETILTKPS